MDKISVIVPVFNVAPYIGRCLDSVLGQTYADLEIICVNDGSTDESGGICDEYAAKDSRVRVFHKKHGGVASARNVGLLNFSGQYVGFVDSDDWIESDMYEVLYGTIRSRGVSVSAVGFFGDTDTGTAPRKNVRHIPDRVLTQREMLSFIYQLDLYNAFHVVVWNKLFCSDLFRNNNGLLFNEHLFSGSDALFLPSVFLIDGCTGTYCDQPLYHYYQRNSSIVHSSTAIIKEKGSLAAHKSVLKMFNDSGYEDLAMLVKKEICYCASLIAELAIKEGDEGVLERMKREMRTYMEDYVELNRDFPARVERIKELINTKEKPLWSL